jgi:NAD(P)-dependent dehydrogenase (short-subunit alcohol dehydrogenase family)
MTGMLAAEPPQSAPSRGLAGQVVLVTGASRGLGRVIAGVLGDAGAATGLIARSAGPLAQTAEKLIARGATAVAVPADVTDPDALAAAVEQVSGRLGPIDVLINNAGVTGPSGRCGRLTQGTGGRPSGPTCAALSPVPGWCCPR